jgi:hypothetical protein
MLQTVRLTVASGDFVVAGRIPFYPAGHPEVLIWGERIFKFAHNTPQGDDQLPVLTYREVFTSALVDCDPIGSGDPLG